MGMKWRPGKVLEREAIKLQRRVSAAIASSRPRVAHTGSRGGLGGSLVNKARSRDILIRGKSHAGVAWSKLGQKFMWFVRGTSRQTARRIELAPTSASLVKIIGADAFRHFSAREREEANRA